MKKRYIKALLPFAFFLYSNFVSGQMVGDCVFLKGKYVEVGIAPNGGYGSTLPAPAGYHPNLGPSGGFTFYDPGAGTSSFSSSLLGFVADYGADGWTVGTPGYFGDYYLPGTPQEGWAIVTGVTPESQAYIPAYQFGPTTGFTGGLAGTNVSYSNSGGISKGVWQGTDGDLTIRQTTTLDTNKLYFTVNVVVINNNLTTAVPDVYYIRTVDPDNEQTVTGDFTTNNHIAYQLPDPENKVLVEATGVTYTNAYVGLGTKDCRAKCEIFHFGGLQPSGDPNEVFNGTASTSYLYNKGATSTEDVGIGLTFQLGTILPGDSTTFSYAYILNATYIDSALNSTLPQFTIDGVASIDTFTDTINFCKPPSPAVNISMVNGGFYHWSYSPSTGLSATTGPTTILDVNAVTADVTYTVTGISPCDTLYYYLKVIHEPYPGPLTTSVTYCQGVVASPLTVSLPATDTLEWWTAATGGVSSPTAPTPSTAVAGTTTYWVSEYHGLCHSDRSAITVTIVPLPSPPYVSGITPYCFGQTFVPFVTAGVGMLWYTGPTGGIGNSTAPTIFTGAAGTYSVYATQTVNGCESPRAMFATTVLPKITPAFTYEKHYGCHGDTVKFTNGSINSSRYLWAFGDGSSDSATNPSHIYSVQGTYSVTMHAANFHGCADSMTQSFDLIHHLHSSFTASPQIICQNQSISFTNASIGIDSTFTWLFGNGDQDINTNTTYTYNHTGVYTVKLITKDFVPCYDTATTVVYVDTISGMHIDLTDTVLCAGTYITQTGKYASIGNTGITWTFDNADSIRDVNPLHHAFNAGKHTIVATAHYRACPEATSTRTIEVMPQPTIDLGKDTSICKGSESIVLKDLNNYQNSAASYVWNTGEHSKTITIVAPGTYYATVNLNNCHASDSILVSNDCYMDIPNAFTPNGDGINDYFFPRQLLTKGLTDFRMNIYNRWGQLIFETTSLDGSGWDGKMNGVDQPSGVYVFMIDASFRDGQKEHHNGNITLLR